MTRQEADDLLQEVEGFQARYAALPSGMSLVIALYSVMTHCFELFDAVPYLAVISPTKGCGKTRVLEILSFLCREAISTVGITAPALFRTIEGHKPTLLADESESFRPDQKSQKLCGKSPMQVIRKDKRSAAAKAGKAETTRSRNLMSLVPRFLP